MAVPHDGAELAAPWPTRRTVVLWSKPSVTARCPWGCPRENLLSGRFRGGASWKSGYPSPTFVRRSCGAEVLSALDAAAAPLPLQRKPAGDRGIHYHALAAIELGDLPKRIGQVAVVEHQHVRKLLNRSRQILHRAREAGRQLLGRHIVPALQNSHRDTLL